MNRRLLTILTAVVLGLIGTFSVLYYVQQADDRAVAGKAATDVLVAAKPIPGGTAVSDLLANGYVRSEPFPASSVPGDALRSLNGLPTDGVVRDSLQTGQLLLGPLIVPRGGTSAFTIPDGKIAVTVQLTDPERVGGYVAPGSKVVVFYFGPEGHGTNVARTLITDVGVLSITTPAHSGSPGPLLTLAVSQQEAEKLVFGATVNGGGLYLGLEGTSSNLSPNSNGVSGLTLFG